MAKSRDAFRTISEVAEWLDVPAHVLRFWESKFSQIKPVKRAGGRRYYRPSDMELISGIQKLLHEDGITIKGVQKILREEGVKHVASLGKAVEKGDDKPVIEAKAEPAPIPEDTPVEHAAVIDLPTAEPVEAEADAAPIEPEMVAPTADVDQTPEPTEAETVAVEFETTPAAEPTPASENDTVEPVALDAALANEPKTVESVAPETADPAQSELFDVQSDDETPETAVDEVPEPVATNTQDPTPEPVAPAPQIAAIDIPDDPTDDDTPIKPSVLAALSNRPSAQAAQLRPLYDRLVALRARM